MTDTQNEQPTTGTMPGEIIRRELEARNWSQADLAAITGRPLQVINEVVAGKRGITPETAQGFAQAFGTTAQGFSQAFGMTAQFWMNLDAAYQLSKGRGPDAAVALRALLFERAPVRELVARGWIRDSSRAEELAEEVRRFYGIDNLEEEPRFLAHAARKSTSYDDVTPAQQAWLFRARQIAERVTAAKFAAEGLTAAVNRLRGTLAEPTALLDAPAILANAGLRLIFLEALPRTRIDGATFWLDDERPALVLALRFDRIDYFWHTLMHELGHIHRGDGRDNDNVRLDTDLIGSHTPPQGSKPGFELAADDFAAASLIDQNELEAFITRTRPLYSRAKILGFADKLNVHPGILVGQLQYRGEILYSHSRDLLIKVRDMMLPAVETDGWGRLPAGN